MEGINWHTFFFLLTSLVTCAFAVAVVVSNNIVRMAFYLIVSLGATSGLFFLAGADFVAAMQLLIYVGGTLVLLIFGVMLTAQGPFVTMKARGGDWVIAAIVGGGLLGLLVTVALSVDDWGGEPLRRRAVAAQEEGESLVEGQVTTTRIGLSLLGVRPEKLDTEPAPGRVDLGKGQSGYLLPFEIVSVHLLVVLIGAAYLARAKKREGPAEAGRP